MHSCLPMLTYDKLTPTSAKHNEQLSLPLLWLGTPAGCIMAAALLPNLLSSLIFSSHPPSLLPSVFCRQGLPWAHAKNCSQITTLAFLWSRKGAPFKIRAAIPDPSGFADFDAAPRVQFCLLVSRVRVWHCVHSFVELRCTTVPLFQFVHIPLRCALADLLCHE